MEAIIVNSENLKLKGTSASKIKFLIDLNGKYYYALFWIGLDNPIVYDEDQDDSLKKFNWYVMQVGYAYNKEEYMHRYILKRYQEIPENLSVDHINEYKLDNRRSNLRIVLHSLYKTLTGKLEATKSNHVKN